MNELVGCFFAGVCIVAGGFPRQRKVEASGGDRGKDRKGRERRGETLACIKY
jgi:hypothetical protein